MTDVTRRDSLKLAATASLAALAGTAAAQDPALRPERPEPPKDRWRAWAVTEGTETKLVVEGVYGEGGLGVVAVVTPAAPQGINPKILILDVKIKTLPGIWALLLTPIPAQYMKAPYTSGTYDSIHLRYPDGSSIMIPTITDAGAGPA